MSKESQQEVLGQQKVLGPLKRPGPLPRRRGNELITGLGFMPEQRLGAFSAEQLELVVRHWVSGLDDRYARVRQAGGTGDKGRDVVGFESAEAEDPWDNFQCKRYGRRLTPSDIWPELCKLVYYASNGAYSVPRNYYFVAPLGCGSTARPKTC